MQRAACSPLPGAEQLWSKPALRWIFVGELHGSNETAPAFLDLVCDALQRGRSVTVALERPTSEQPALDQILTAQDIEGAKRNLLLQPDWKNGMDGRASEAMLRLMLALRNLRHSYANLTVKAFDAASADTGAGARDKAMGDMLLALGKVTPTNLNIILTGNVHGMQAPLFGYDFAAMYLPAAERLSLEVTDRGGASWTTYDGACGPAPGGVPDKDPSGPRGIYLDPSLAPYGKIDGVLSLGVALTASPPAAGEPSPPPDCRIKYLSKHPSPSAGQP